MPGIITVRLRKRREDVGREADAHIIALNTIHRPSGGGVYSECIVQQRQLHKSRGLSLPLCVCVCLHTCVVQCGGRMGRDAFCFITACQGGKKVPLVCGGPGREEWKPKKRKCPHSANPLYLRLSRSYRFPVWSLFFLAFFWMCTHTEIHLHPCFMSCWPQALETNDWQPSDLFCSLKGQHGCERECVCTRECVSLYTDLFAASLDFAFQEFINPKIPQ